MSASHRPLVIAHRGASDVAAEHTLGAYVAALGAGADGLECDVRLTADGHLVCVHDRDLRRTAGTRGTISTMRLEELSDLDFASWKHPWADLDDEAPDRDSALDGVLTLRRLLETVADAGRRVEVAIETKHPTRYAGLVEKRVVELLRDFGWDGADSPVRLMSFSWTAVQRFEQLAPAVPRVMLLDKGALWPVIRRGLRRGASRGCAVGPGIDELRVHPELGRRIVEAGHPLDVWVVNTATDLELCRELGARAVITDRPAHLLGLLDQ